MIKLLMLSSKIDDLKNAIGFDIIINQSLKAKNMSLKIDTKKQIPILTLPKFFIKKQALEFINKHQDWITEKLNSLPQQQTFKFNQDICLFDKTYTIIPSTDCISCCKIQGNILYAPTDEELLHSRVIKFIKKLAKEKLTLLSHQKAQEIGKTINNIVIKDTKSRWGSCSSQNNINYNFRLAFAPLYVADSIVCHEVCHLKEHNHGESFYKLLHKICPEYTKSEQWLKKNSKELYVYK